MINRRIFLKSALYAGSGVFASRFLSCKSDDPVENLTDSPSSDAEITPKPGMDLYGLITDTDGNPIEGVVVSDGFNCVVTDKDGIYQMKKNSQAKIVFYSTPEQYTVKTTNNALSAAAFYSPITSANKRYDFSLTKLPKVETDFTLVCIGDPQVASASDMARFKLETMTDLKKFVDEANKPCYGLIMGDVVSDHPEFFPQMKILMGSTKMPYFTTIGNHDKAGAPRNTEQFNAAFGPVDYSFNRGNVHFVSLDNIIYSNASDYAGGFTDSQVEWLKQDLSYVPKDKLVIVYYHIPIRNTASVKNRTGILDSLKKFDNVHLMCGHTHYSEYSMLTNPAIYEHIHAAACGSWWKSTVNGDGTPNGYAVYEISGNKFTNWYYKPTNYDKNFQIRIHRGNTSFGGQYGTYSYNQGNNIVANIWYADPDWKLEAYEDGVKAGNLTKLASSNKDAFTLGYHIGVLNRNPANYSPANYHAYLHTLKDPNAQVIEIKATDKFGTVYTQSEIISDLTTAAKY